jgi:predicted DNA binding CopG/RHH family protein
VRLPSAALEGVKAKAEAQGARHQRFIRRAPVQAVSGPKG